MARPTSLDKVRRDRERLPVERMADVMVDYLKGVSSPRQLIMSADRVPDVDQWRKAARRAGRQLGWKVRTGESNGVLWMIDVREHEELPFPLSVADDRKNRQAMERLNRMVSEAMSGD